MTVYSMGRNLNKKRLFDSDSDDIGGVRLKAQTVHPRSRYRAATLIGRTPTFVTILVLDVLAEIANEDS